MGAGGDGVEGATRLRRYSVGLLKSLHKPAPSRFMPRLPRLTAAEAEAPRVVVPFHGNETLHLKIVKQVLEAFDELTVAPDITM